jgi:hypothetical protein
VSEQASFTLRRRNPDVLTCIANLSNDEVFTPPEFANRMLDTLTEAWAANHQGANLWADPTVTFLDPCTKSGVFLREITRRLTEGLEAKMPNLEQRVNHILTKQVFGIGITQITCIVRGTRMGSTPSPRRLATTPEISGSSEWSTLGVIPSAFIAAPRRRFWTVPMHLKTTLTPSSTPIKSRSDWPNSLGKLCNSTSL